MNLRILKKSIYFLVLLININHPLFARNFYLLEPKKNNQSNSLIWRKVNSKTNVNYSDRTFVKYVQESGFKNPYDNNAEIIKYTGSGGDTVDGRMRLDYESCKVGTKLNLWVKTHKETLKESHSRDGWCSY